jgi:hypothetical protein
LTYTAVCLLLFIIGADSWSDGWGATKKPWEVDRARWGIQAATAEVETTATDPRDVAGLVAYFRADTLIEEADASFPESSDNMVKITSIDATGYIQTATTDPPSYETDVLFNGHGSIWFDGSEYIEAITTSYTDLLIAGYTVMWLGRIADGQSGSGRDIFGAYSTAGKKYIKCWLAGGASGLISAAIQNTTTKTISVGVCKKHGTLALSLITITCDTSGYMVAYVNGVAKDSVDVTAIVYNGIRNNVLTEKIPIAGSWTDGAGTVGKHYGRWCAQAIWGRPLNWQERVDAELNIATYWGVSLGTNPLQ